jgi:hypothetical protein
MSLNTGEIPALLVHFCQPNTGVMALGQSLAMAGDFARMDPVDSNLDSGFARSFFPAGPAAVVCCLVLGDGETRGDGGCR